MNNDAFSRRQFLKTTGLAAGTFIVSPAIARSALATQTESATPDYVLHIKNSTVEIAPKRFISVTTYNGQFPGPLLRFKEGQPVTIDIFNDTDTPEQLHWHGQRVPTDIDGAAEGRDALHSSPRKASHHFHSQSSRLAFLSHAQSRGCQSRGWTI